MAHMLKMYLLNLQRSKLFTKHRKCIFYRLPFPRMLKTFLGDAKLDHLRQPSYQKGMATRVLADVENRHQEGKITAKSVAKA